jgi:putative transposase
VGLHADRRCAEERRPSGQPVDDRPDPESGGRAARTRATDLMADVSAGALGAIAGADFFTTEVWTWRGLVTFYTVFVIDLASRRVHIVGSTPHPDEGFMRQVTRTLTAAGDRVLGDRHVLICGRDAKWSAAVRARLGEAGIRVVQTPYLAPNANAYAERFVRSIKEECLDRVIPFGEGHLRRTIAEYVEHYHRERNHQGIENMLIAGVPATGPLGRIRRRPRLGGVLNYYERAA